MRPGDSIPAVAVTPGPEATRRYAEASGDLNPIHTDDGFARRAGFPGVILHGMYSMAQVARATVDAAGADPRRLRRLSVQFRGIGVPQQPITITGSVREERDGRLLLDVTARQQGRRLIRAAEAEIER